MSILIIETFYFLKYIEYVQFSLIASASNKNVEKKPLVAATFTLSTN